MTIKDYMSTGFVPFRDLALSKDDAFCLCWKLRAYIEDLNPGCKVSVSDAHILSVFPFSNDDKVIEEYNIIHYSIGEYFGSPALLRQDSKKELIYLETPDNKFLQLQFQTKAKPTESVIENMKCPFCNIADDEKVIVETPSALAIFDKFPVSQGHALIFPRRHVESYNELSYHEHNTISALIHYVRKKNDERFHPDGYNIGVNIGEHAGQTISHCCMHIIPRYKGDAEGPNRGILNVVL